ncbi:hypothetical protein Lser_V15G19695 [Lactuca serriola]
MAMAFSSTSSVHKSFKYDVFLSFRGEDTRTNFVDHLYHALQQKSIHTYKDDEKIKKGKKISDELIGSIEDSKFYIIVFSKNYASSSWCLDELVKIMECHRTTTEHTAYPVFYDVEPSEVRKQSGAVGEAFAKYEMEEAAGKWRLALKEAADLAGWELKKTADGHEAKVIQKIIEELSLELRSISFTIDEKLVGMETRIQDLVPSLGNGCDDVRMIGIKGIGGGGKTTLARAIFDDISFRFEGRSFVENVRENASFSGLKSLQKQVLSDVLNEDIRVSSIYDGKHMMKRRMRDKKVLVVLDDVDHIDQLEALAGELNWFKLGSRIIITTRDEQVLVAHRVRFIHDVNLLSDNEAICLFNRCAFGGDIPVKEYDELSRQVDYKEMFLDVACIMKGCRKDDAIKALECCGFHARNGLRVLKQKSLITINYDNSNKCKYVGMHDHLEEMGRNIVRRSHPDKPQKHTRLWICEEIGNVLANDLGTKATRCIRLNTQNSNRIFDIKGLGKMKELRFLYVGAARGVYSDSNLYWVWNIVNPEFPNALRYLHIIGYPFRSLPITFQASNLVALKMASSKIVQLWEGGEQKVLNKLRILDLSCSMLTTLDLGLTPNLETLDLGRCSNLADLRMPVECLKLIRIDLSNSSLIRTLDLRLAPNLKELILNFCKCLEKLQMPDRCLNLKYLGLANSKLRTLDIGLNPNLQELVFGKCDYLEELNMVNECQYITNLNIRFSRLRVLNLGLFPNLKRCLNLKYLRISYSKLRTLDIGQTPNLRNLDLYKNSHLEELYMGNECQMLTNLNISHSKLRSLDLGLTPNLEILQLDKCYNLVELMCSCTYLKKFSGSICGLRHLRQLKLEGSILEVPEDLYKLENLKELILSSTEVRYLPDSICMLKHLECLELNHCWFLEKLPEELGRLECLKLLNIEDTSISHLPHSILLLKGLHIVGSRDLLESGMIFRRLEGLQKPFYKEPLQQRERYANVLVVIGISTLSKVYTMLFYWYPSPVVHLQGSGLHGLFAGSLSVCAVDRSGHVLFNIIV